VTVAQQRHIVHLTIAVPERPARNLVDRAEGGSGLVWCGVPPLELGHDLTREQIRERIAEGTHARVCGRLGGRVGGAGDGRKPLDSRDFRCPAMWACSCRAPRA